MATENSKASDEAQIRVLIDDRVKAVRAKDINGTMANTAPDILSFDVVNPLQNVGAGASRKRAAEWFASFQGLIGHEVCDLSITTGDDVAYSHSLNRVMGTTTGGKEIDMYWRATVCYHKIDGKWLVTHEHNSVPFDPASGKSSLDLKP
jgi:ketosteroid isomerase-like protein